MLYLAAPSPLLPSACRPRASGSLNAIHVGPAPGPETWLGPACSRLCFKSVRLDVPALECCDLKHGAGCRLSGHQGGRSWQTSPSACLTRLSVIMKRMPGSEQVKPQDWLRTASDGLKLRACTLLRELTCFLGLQLILLSTPAGIVLAPWHCQEHKLGRASAVCLPEFWVGSGWKWLL